MDKVKTSFDDIVSFAEDTKEGAMSFIGHIVDRFGKTMRRSSVQRDYVNESRRKYYENKYQHKRTKRAVEALERWKKERPQVLLNRNRTN